MARQTRKLLIASAEQANAQNETLRANLALEKETSARLGDLAVKRLKEQDALKEEIERLKAKINHWAQIVQSAHELLSAITPPLLLDHNVS